MRFTILACLMFAGVAACGDDHDDGEAEPFDTYQECYTDHHEEESLPVQEAIVICCLEHPIAGVVEVCGDTEASCQTYLGANLDPADATSAEVTAACTDYVSQKGM